MVEADKANLRAYAIFADGGIALIDDIVTDEEVTENDIKRIYNYFYLKPYTKISIEHNVTERDEGFQNSGKYMGFYKRRFLKEWCKPLSLSIRSSVWFLFTDWKGNSFIDIFGGELRRLLDKLRQMQKEILGLRGQISSLQYENIKMSKDVLGYELKKGEKMQKLIKASTIIVGGENKEQQGGEYGEG